MTVSDNFEATIINGTLIKVRECIGIKEDSIKIWTESSIEKDNKKTELEVGISQFESNMSANEASKNILEERKNIIDALFQ